MRVSALPPSDERAGVTRLRQPQAPVAQPAHQTSEQCQHPMRDRHRDEWHVNTATAHNRHRHRVAQLAVVRVKVQRTIIGERVTDGVARYRCARDLRTIGTLVVGLDGQCSRGQGIALHRDGDWHRGTGVATTDREVQQLITHQRKPSHGIVLLGTHRGQ